MKKHLFTNKLQALQAARPVWCCEQCRTKHDAPLLAQCKYCKKPTKQMQSIPGQKRNKNCPNCARPGLVNKRIAPLVCVSCGAQEFMYFHSTGEYTYFAKLAMLFDHGKIKDLKLQVKFPILIKGDAKPICTYIADFAYTDVETGERRVLDYKGNKEAVTAEFKLKKKLVERFFPGTTIQVVFP